MRNQINGIIFLLILIAILPACNNKKQVVTSPGNTILLSPDTALHIINGKLSYQQQLFTGTLKELYVTGKIKSIQRIQDGRQEGLSETFYENGKKESVRWYSKGEKDSIHSGWWPTGNLKYEYHFKNGSYHGMFSEWYANKKKYQQVMYANGNEVYGQGWRESGKLYMNFVMKNGRRYGLNNSNLCYSVSGKQ